MTEKFGQFNLEHLKKVKEGIELFNEQKYWECHEALEDIWMEDRNDPARNVYWAIIQVAAAMIHYRDGNILGAQGLINKAREKFKRCEDQQIETEFLYKYLSWAELKEMTYIIPVQGALLSHFSNLFDFRFKDYHGF